MGPPQPTGVDVGEQVRFRLQASLHVLQHREPAPCQFLHLERRDGFDASHPFGPLLRSRRAAGGYVSPYKCSYSNHSFPPAHSAVVHELHVRVVGGHRVRNLHIDRLELIVVGVDLLAGGPLVLLV